MTPLSVTDWMLTNVAVMPDPAAPLEAAPDPDVEELLDPPPHAEANSTDVLATASTSVRRRKPWNWLWCMVPPGGPVDGLSKGNAWLHT